MKTAWQRTVELEFYPQLREDIEADIVIIGGGITGITTAYLLAKEGKRVAVLEKKSLKESVTAYTTGFLVADIDTDAKDLVRMFGEDDARDVWRSHQEAIDATESIIKAEGIECEFRRCVEYLYATDSGGFDSMKTEMDLGTSFGFDMGIVAEPGERSPEVPFEHEGAVALRNQAKFHPLKYLKSLRQIAEKNGAKFYEFTEALSVSGCETITVKTHHGEVRAKAVVSAAYHPFKQPSRLFFKKGTYFSYVYELSVPHGQIPEGLYVDDNNPYNYVRVDAHAEAPGYDRMLLGGADHRHELRMDKDKNYAGLKKYLRKQFPNLSYKMVSRWYGPILEPSDGLALIGRYSKSCPNWYVASAFSGNGMTYAMIAAQTITALVCGREYGYAYLYDPMRPLLTRRLWTKARDYIGEFFGGAFRNFFNKREPEPKPEEILKSA